METTTQNAVQTYTVDPAHSRAGFTVRHLGFSKVRGRFEHVEATLRLDPDDLATLETTATIQARSITTGDPKRDEHLRSGDFFEVETYPEITFESTGVANVDGQRFTLLGTLTMHGVTKSVELDAEYLGTRADPWGGARVAFEAKTTINRKDWDLNWNTLLEAGGFLVSEDVDLELDIQAVQKKDEPA